MKFIISITIFMALNFPFSAFSFEAAVLQHNICNFQTEYRSIRIQKNKTNSCDAVYTKIGKDARLGGGQFMLSCENIFNNVIANLTKAGWECKNAFGSGFTIERKS